jgi:hypothetical protein
MACSGGWDWAPYSQAGDERGSRVFTFAIVQPLYIATVESVFITDMVPKRIYLGPYPQSPLWGGPADVFVVRVEVHVRCAVDTKRHRNVLTSALAPISPMKPFGYLFQSYVQGMNKRYPSTRRHRKRALNCGGLTVLESSHFTCWS